VVICLERGANDLHNNGPDDATATRSSLAPAKSRMVYLSGAGLYPGCPGKRPLNGCSVVVVGVVVVVTAAG